MKKTFRKKIFRRRFKKKFRSNRNAKFIGKGSSQVTVTRTVGGFPDRYFCPLRVDAFLELGATNTVGPMRISLKGNSLTYCGPAINGSGYANNVPAGLNSLLCSYTDIGSSQPYTAYRVWGSKIKISFTPGAYGSLGAQPTSYDWCLVPGIQSYSDSWASPTQSTVFEQMRCKTRKVASNFTNKASVIAHRDSTRRVEGIKYKAAIEGNSNFTGSSGAVPATQWFWNLVFFGDGTNKLQGRVDIQIIYLTEFFNKTNSIGSAIPS